MDQDHPFWRAEPLAIKREEKRLIEKGNMLLIHPKMKTHVLGYPAGLWLENQAHAAAKYSKFVYSSRFGFSVPKAGARYEEGLLITYWLFLVMVNIFVLKESS